MKRKLAHGAAAVIVGALFSTPTPAAPIETAKPVNDVRELFVPVGFDNNDNVQVVVSGYLDGVCYQLRQPKVEVDVPQHKVKLTINQVRVQQFCHPIAIRYNQVVNVGALPAGTFTVEASGDTSPMQLVINRSVNPGPDDLPYAPVESARLILGSGGDMSVSLRGHLTNTCQRFESVKVTQHGKTIEVMPIMKVTAQDEQGKPCQTREADFEKRTDLPKLEKGRYLLHVRAAGGQSLNEVFDYPYPWDDRDH